MSTLRKLGLVGRRARLTTLLALGVVFGVSSGLFWWLPNKTAAIVINAGSVVALVTSVIAMRDSERIRESMSTRYIGRFPDNVAAVVALVGSATRTLKIVSDHVGYGQFSDPGGCEQYKHEIHRRIADKRVSVDIGVYAESQFQAVAQSQLDCMTKDFVAFTNGKAFKRFAQWRPELAAKMRESPHAFFANMFQNEKGLREEFGSFHARVHTTENHMPVYMWIADDNHAIFCVVVRKDSSDLEYAFETRDGNLIKALAAMADAYLQTA